MNFKKLTSIKWCVSQFAGYILEIETDYILKTV